MKGMDLEKVIIILALVLLPVAGGWVYFLTEDLAAAERALSSSMIETKMINAYRLQDTIDQTKKMLEDQGGEVGNYNRYFEERLFSSVPPGSDITANHITVNQLGNTRQAGRGRYEDVEVDVKFDREMRLGRDFVNAYIYNCEMKTPIWRLRNLKMSNPQFKSAEGSVPPLEMEDNWKVDIMHFARRMPVK